MRVCRSRIIVNYKDNSYLELVKDKKIDIVYESKENYAIIYCDRNDENFILESIKSDNSVIDAYVSNERVDKYNF